MNCTDNRKRKSNLPILKKIYLNSAEPKRISLLLPLFGLLLLAALSRHVRPGSLLLGATGLFAVGLIAFSSSTSSALPRP